MIAGLLRGIAKIDEGVPSCSALKSSDARLQLVLEVNKS